MTMDLLLQKYGKRIAEAEAAYLSMSRELKDLKDFMMRKDSFDSQIWHIDALSHTRTNVEYMLQTTIGDEKAPNIPTIYVVENVSPAIIAILGSEWNIEPAFFASHISKTREAKHWRPCHWSEAEEPRQHRYKITGVYRSDGHAYDTTASYESSANYYIQNRPRHQPHGSGSYMMNISYIRVNVNLYLFLVDSPITNDKSPWSGSQGYTPRMTFPYSRDRGGLLIPSETLYTHFIPAEALQAVLKHRGVIKWLFCSEWAFPDVPLMYLISASLWFTKLASLDQAIKTISFHEIQEPDLKITNTLHRLREELSFLQKSIASTSRYMPPDVDRFFATLNTEECFYWMNTPSETFKDMLDRATDLHSFLLETFQLLMNTIAVKDGQTSLEIGELVVKQTKQGILLTRLATIYLPFSLATSVFGMNIDQLNGTGQSIWVFVVTCVAVLVATILVLRVQEWPRFHLMAWVKVKRKTANIGDYVEKGSSK